MHPRAIWHRHWAKPGVAPRARQRLRQRLRKSGIAGDEAYYVMM